MNIQELKPGDQIYVKRHIILDDLIHGGLATVDTINHNCLSLKEITNHRLPITSPLLANQVKLAKRYGHKKAKLTPTKLLFF